MSDYEVNLVNDNMQEFYVRFYGPAESTSTPPTLITPPRVASHVTDVCSTLCRRRVEDPRRAPRSISIQITEYRLHEQDIPSKYR